MNYLSLYMLHLCGDTDLLMPFLFYTVLPRLCFSGLAPLVYFIALAYLALINIVFPMSNAFMRRSHVYALSAVASAFLFQHLTFIDSIFYIIVAKLVTFLIPYRISYEKSQMSYDILTEGLCLVI